MLPFTPQFQSDTNAFFCDSVKWFEEHYTFQSKGNEQYLIIGVFTSLYVSKTSDYFGNITSGPEPGTEGLNSYYYIDDVSLTKTSYDLPNVFTPNNDGTNDLFTFHLVEAAEMQIINRWGNVIYESNTVFEWDGKSGGDDCPEGVYFYRIKTKSDYIMNGFISLMR
jgi:gliding motility-associated-like protein